MIFEISFVDLNIDTFRKKFKNDLNFFEKIFMESAISK